MRFRKNVFCLLMTIPSSRCEATDPAEEVDLYLMDSIEPIYGFSAQELGWLTPKKAPNSKSSSLKEEPPKAEEYVQKFLMSNKFLLFLSLTPLLFKAFYGSFLQYCLSISDEIQNGLLLVSMSTIALTLGTQIIGNFIQNIGAQPWLIVFLAAIADTGLASAAVKAAQEGEVTFLTEPETGIIRTVSKEVSSWVVDTVSSIIRHDRGNTNFIAVILKAFLIFFENRLVNKILSIFYETSKDIVDALTGIFFQILNNALMHWVRREVLNDAAIAVFKKPTRFYTTVNSSSLALTMSRLPEAIKETYLTTYLPFLQNIFDFGFSVLAETICRNPMAWLYVGIIYHQALQVRQKEFLELQKQYQDYINAQTELHMIPESLVANSLLIKFGNPQQEVANFLQKKKEVNKQLFDLQEKIKGLKADNVSLEPTTIVRIARNLFIIVGFLAQKDFRTTLFMVPACFMQMLRQVQGIVVQYLPGLKEPIDGLLFNRSKTQKVTLTKVMICLFKLGIIYTYLSEKEEQYYKSTAEQSLRFTVESQKAVASPEIQKYLDMIYSDLRKVRQTTKHYKVRSNNSSKEERIRIIMRRGFQYKTKESEKRLDVAKHQAMREYALTKPLPNYGIDL